MKVVLLQHLSGAKAYEAGEEIEVTDQEALRFIKKGIAKAKNKAAHKALMDKSEKLEQEESDKKAKILAIQKGEELKVEAEALLEDLVAIVSIIESIEPDYKVEFLESFHKKFTGDDTEISGEDETGGNNDTKNTEG